MVSFDISLQGLQNAQDRFDQAATNIARGSLPANSSEPDAPADTVSLSDQMVALLQARNDFQANLRVVHTADEMTHDLLNVLG